MTQPLSYMAHTALQDPDLSALSTRPSTPTTPAASGRSSEHRPSRGSLANVHQLSFRQLDTRCEGKKAGNRRNSYICKISSFFLHPHPPPPFPFFFFFFSLFFFFKLGESVLNANDPPAFNVRKLIELPYHLTEAGRMEELVKSCLGNFSFIMAKVRAVGLAELLSDFQAVPSTSAVYVDSGLQPHASFTC